MYGIFFMGISVEVYLSAFFPRGSGEDVKSKGNQLVGVGQTCRGSFLEFFKMFEQCSADPACPVCPVGIHGDTFETVKQQSYELDFVSGVHWQVDAGAPGADRTSNYQVGRFNAGASISFLILTQN